MYFLGVLDLDFQDFQWSVRVADGSGFSQSTTCHYVPTYSGPLRLPAWLPSFFMFVCPSSFIACINPSFYRSVPGCWGRSNGEWGSGGQAFRLRCYCARVGMYITPISHHICNPQSGSLARFAPNPHVKAYARRHWPTSFEFHMYLILLFGVGLEMTGGIHHMF